MLQITKIEPQFFTDAKKKVKKTKQSKAWSEIKIDKQELKKFILNEEQYSMCAYCEKKITIDNKKSNTDHFKTRHSHPELTLDYTNLFVSCTNRKHCESIKDNSGLVRVDFNKLISPLTISSNDFTYSKTGDILGMSDNAKFTSKIFNLNDISLVQERLQIIKGFDAYKDFDENLLIDAFASHKSLIIYLKAQEN